MREHCEKGHTTPHRGWQRLGEGCLGLKAKGARTSEENILKIGGKIHT